MTSKRKLKKLYKAVTNYVQADLDQKEALEHEDFADAADYESERDELFWVLYEVVQKDIC